MITEGFDASRVACSEMPRLVSLIESVFEAGWLSGSADENAHSSSSGAGAAAREGVAGIGFAKSKMDGRGCWGVDCSTDEARAANGSIGGVWTNRAFAAAAACCC